MQTGKSIDEIAIGEKASATRTISEADVLLFAELTNDRNPVHIDEEYARQSIFGTRIAHGSFTTALVSAVLGMQLPGLGTIAYESRCRFRYPVYLGDTITATVEAVEKKPAKNLVTFKCSWTNQTGIIVADGEAVVMPPRKKA
jgi:3-hydroxybutyryl-CoA dehydratase